MKNQQFMTKKELTVKINEYLQKATLKDKKWLFCYFSEFDEWPLITDEVPEPVSDYQYESGETVTDQ